MGGPFLSATYPSVCADRLGNLDEVPSFPFLRLSRGGLHEGSGLLVSDLLSCSPGSRRDWRVAAFAYVICTGHADLVFFSYI